MTTDRSGLSHGKPHGFQRLGLHRQGRLPWRITELCAARVAASIRILRSWDLMPAEPMTAGAGELATANTRQHGGVGCSSARGDFTGRSIRSSTVCGWKFPHKEQIANAAGWMLGWMQLLEKALRSAIPEAASVRRQAWGRLDFSQAEDVGLHCQQGQVRVRAWKPPLMAAF